MDSDRTMARQIGRRVRELRETRGLSQDELASHAGLGSQGALSNVEQGKRLPSLPTVLALADALGVPLTEIIEPAPANTASRRQAHHLVDQVPDDSIGLVVRLLEAVVPRGEGER
jgi:transcriptional regulator with XRE-family HTH domain